MAPKVRRQRTTEMPLGDALLRFAQVVHQQRKAIPSGMREQLLREQDALRTALNGFTVNVQFACRFMPGQTFNDLPDADGDGDIDALDLLKYGAEKACCGVVKSKPTYLAPASPAKPKPRVKT